MYDKNFTPVYQQITLFPFSSTERTKINKKICLTIITICNIVASMGSNAKQFSGTKESELQSICRKHGLALTIQRRAILENLAGRNDHPTADQLYDSIKDQLKGVSKTTVYRILETLVSVGVIRKVSNPESISRFDADTSRHHHLICVECGTVIDIHDEELNRLELPECFKSDFEFHDYSINFSGRCSRCRKTGDNETPV
jgi:Fur family peroxide stress response transcriptional regulator